MRCTSFHQMSCYWWLNRSAVFEKISLFLLTILSVLDDAFWKLRMYHIEQFSMFFSELFLSHQFFWDNWLSLNDNDLVEDVSFKTSFLQSFFYATALHWRIFWQNNISKRTIHDVFLYHISLFQMLYSSMLSYTYFTRISTS